MNTLKKSIGLLLPAIRISFALVMLTACLFLTAEMLGLVPDETRYLLNARKQVSEALAIQFSVFIPDEDSKKIQKTLGYVVKRDPEIESAGIRLINGQLIFQVGDHIDQWSGYDKKKSDSSHLIVPLFKNNELWGEIELKFAPLRGESSFDYLNRPIIKMGLFVLLMGFFAYLAFMVRTLRILDPTRAIPERVNAAFDTLAEGVIILDEQENIVLANKAFTEKLSLPISTLLGVKASSLKWKMLNSEHPNQDFPWQDVLKTGNSSLGVQLMLASSKDENFKFVINASPIQGEKDLSTQGVLITLDDITELEEQNTTLQIMVSSLEESRAQVQLQNKELHYLATRDPLTGCLNRRAFNEQFEKAYATAKENNIELSCIMADLDHFKSVNDNFGHSVGDEVIKLFAEVLQSNTRKIDLVSRYGGEEFCVILPGLAVEDALLVAERIRLRIKDETTKTFENGPMVTVSLGVASMRDNPQHPVDLYKFADQALYVAKKAGRNRVIRWQEKSDSEILNEVTSKQVEKNTQTETIESDNETIEVSELQLRVNKLEELATKFSAELEYRNNYDSLTGLPNHVLFYDRIGQVIERAYRFDQLASILVVDIGMLSQINATLGRNIGDKLIIEIAERLKTIFRKYDGISCLTLSRFGGNEFAVLLTDLPSKETITWIVKRLLDSLATPLEIDGNSIYLTNYVGISVFPSDADCVDDLLNNAMIAKKYCKESPEETNYQFYNNSMQELSIKHMKLDRELRRAIQNEEWELLYQPKMDIKTKTIVGSEALIRWKHPTRGLLSPFEFIDFAEQRGLIVAIGDWVIKTVCRQLKQWRKLGITETKIAVNLSAIQIRQEDFVEKIFHMLSAEEVPPRQLELEITETTLMNNFQVALVSLKRLNMRGITIAIDDFGTGYSSLNYLKTLPINTLKIDRAFIKDICTDENDKKIVNALIYMAHSMDMGVVAEGVEEQNQLDLLSQYSCDEIQGYLLSKPIPAKELTEMLSISNKKILEAL